jgi:hypothetical protein
LQRGGSLVRDVCEEIQPTDPGQGGEKHRSFNSETEVRQ